MFILVGSKMTFYMETQYKLKFYLIVHPGKLSQKAILYPMFVMETSIMIPRNLILLLMKYLKKMIDMLISNIGYFNTEIIIKQKLL